MSSAARAAGLKTAFALPFVIGDEIVAVIESFLLTVVQSYRNAPRLARPYRHSNWAAWLNDQMSDLKLCNDALHDSLTGLPKRRALLEQMDNGYFGQNAGSSS